ncbi:hypothetical protein [Leptospira bandrabouensis]|uniref:hypothetical protein n=1 Tax=Leptospira bandrabouensis TaxID=2484903 RepID=UPI001EEB8791|nr:hypothetical protein [Leptospira bandrabouensis]MCG6154026.1 hypothetical protein [Leptospira bandrabouensis]
MNKEEKLEQQTKDLYRAIGRFSVEFEHLCWNIKNSIVFLMQDNKNPQSQKYLRVLLADQTAYPLITKLKSISSIRLKDYQEELLLLDPLFKFCIKINETRNDIIHGTWFIGWVSEEQTEFDIAIGIKEKNIKSGIDIHTREYKAEHFDLLSSKLKMGSEYISKIFTGLSFLNFLPSKSIKKENLDLLN